MKTISRYNQKTDTTAKLYCTLSMCKTLKTISHCNQKTNTPPQLYCTLSSTCICKPKPFSRQNQKLTQHTAQLEKRFLQPTRSKCIFSSVCLSIRKGQESRENCVNHTKLVFPPQQKRVKQKSVMEKQETPSEILANCFS